MMLLARNREVTLSGYVPRTNGSADGQESCVVLAGGWSRVCAEQLRELFDVRQVDAGGGCNGAVGPAQNVGWLLAEVGVDAVFLRGMLRMLRAHSPNLRLGVMRGAYVDIDDSEIDLHIPTTARPADIVSALLLARRGFAINGTMVEQPRERHQLRLTARERELLDVLCMGLGNDQIARSMNISRRTVEFHLTRIFRKLGVASRVEAIVRAQQ